MKILEEGVVVTKSSVNFMIRDKFPILLTVFNNFKLLSSQIPDQVHGSVVIDLPDIMTQLEISSHRSMMLFRCKLSTDCSWN